MSVRFIIGRAGSGKTRHCFRAIVDALRDDPLGPPIYWLLPRQATFLAERKLTCESGLGGFCRARVLSFNELAVDILTECGGAATPEVTQLGRQMILGHLLRRHESSLKFFGKAARQPGLAARLETTLAEFEHCGRDPVQLQQLLNDMATSQASRDADGDGLYAKLHDICLIYRAYCDYLGQERLDPRRRMESVLRCIGESRRLSGATFYADGFSEFDEFERRILCRLGGICQRLEIGLLMDPDSPVLRDPTHAPAEMNLFHRHEKLYRRLVKALGDEGVAIEPPLLLRKIERFESGNLSVIEEQLFASAPVRAISASADITFVEAPDRRSEVEHAARHIGELLARGLRMRNIAIVTRRLDVYGHLIDTVFGEHQLRCFVDRRRGMAHHPLLEFLRSALAIARGDWPHEAVMKLLKTGLAGLSDDEADRLENYVLEHRVRGAAWLDERPWAWSRRAAATMEEHTAPPLPGDPSAAADALRRRISIAFSPFLPQIGGNPAAIPLRQVVLAILKLLDDFSVPQTLAKWIASARAGGQFEQAGEHEQVWAGLVGLLDEMVDLFGDEPVTAADFNDILESALETIDLALTPPTVDQILVGQIDRTRTPDVKVVLLLGLNDGMFPFATRDGSILTDADRFELQQRDVDLDPGDQQRLLDERLLGYIAFTRASQRLYVSRCTADDAGRPLGPSPFWLRLRELMPAAPCQSLPRDASAEPGLIATPRQLLTSLLLWVRNPAAVPPQAEPSFRSLYQWLCDCPTDDSAVDGLRHRTWRALSYRNDAALLPELAAGLFPSPLRASVTQIEHFAACGFKHFLRFGLSLAQRDDDESLSLNLDHAFHQVLENLVREMLRRRADWTSLKHEEAIGLVSAYAQRIGQSLRGEMMLSHARNRYLLGRIERELDRVIAAQNVVASRGEFRTAFAKLEFGTDGAALPPLIVKTPRGSELLLSGQIDRVDVLPDQAAFAVLDYRLTGSDVNLNAVYHGLSLQLLSYLLVVQAHSGALSGRTLTPAAGFYIRLLRQLEKVKHPSDAPNASDPDAALNGKRRGIFNEAYFRQMDNATESGGSSVFNAYVKKDSTLGNRGRTDVAGAEEFSALLEHVRQTLGDLAEQIVSGSIEIRPYKMGTASACPSCRYKDVCRFDSAINGYRHIPPAGREEILGRVQRGADEPH